MSRGKQDQLWRGDPDLVFLKVLLCGVFPHRAIWGLIAGSIRIQQSRGDSSIIDQTNCLTRRISLPSKYSESMGKPIASLLTLASLNSCSEGPARTCKPGMVSATT